MVVLVFFLRHYFSEQIRHLMTYLLQEWLPRPLSINGLRRIFLDLTVFFFRLMGPVFVGAVAIGLLANYGQVGFRISSEAVEPRLGNINPLQGMKRIFSRRAAVEFLKSLLKIVIVGIVGYQMVKGDLEKLLFLVDLSLFDSFEVVSALIFQVGLGATSAFLLIAVLDYIYQRREFEKSIRMSKQEVKEELKQTEGDPFLKAKLREKQRKLAMHRMMQRVPEATVVITNPTHLAVALRYREGEDAAPLVLAKGAGAVANRIVAVAKENAVPIVEDKPVARFIFDKVDIGQEIPPELYQAVAEILAMLYRMGRKDRQKI
ncbi:MAG: EscU/YscU/HrcU family type III secretion system export apparatus switch protein [Clostridia bacterium]|nr:EscU/YscU/HrcU family type III secretion system export apparatus switch protein [Clostridia bacterium]